jgi:hypothetical protein
MIRISIEVHTSVVSKTACFIYDEKSDCGEMPTRADTVEAYSLQEQSISNPKN